MATISKQLTKQVLSLTNRLIFLEKKSLLRHGDLKLYPSEIHLLDVIDRQPEIHATDIAARLGVTKGAVSQHLKKLEKKGLTMKEEDPENLSRSIVRLTSKGKAAHYAHKHWHETMDGGFKEYTTNLEEEKIAFLLEFITRVEDFLSRIMDMGK